MLYVFRTPPGIKVGREPFPPEVRKALEAQYPNIDFDWDRIASTPIPSVETERWRERRRAEKMAKSGARRDLPIAESPTGDAELEEPAAGDVDTVDEIVSVEPVSVEPIDVTSDTSTNVANQAGASPVQSGAPAGEDGRRRRRRRRRRRSGAPPEGSPGPRGSSDGNV